MRRVLPLVILSLLIALPAFAQFDDVLKRAEKTLNSQSHDTSGLSDTKISSGLREALRVSASRAVAYTGRPDGFLKNQAIKIMLPDKLRSVGNGLRMVGMGAQGRRTRSRNESRRRAGHARREADLPQRPSAHDLCRCPPDPHRRRHRGHRFLQAHQHARTHHRLLARRQALDGARWRGASNTTRCCKAHPAARPLPAASISTSMFWEKPWMASSTPSAKKKKDPQGSRGADHMRC